MVAPSLGAQPPPVPTVEVPVDNELSCLLQPFFSLVTERGARSTSHPSPNNVVSRSSVDACKKSAHLPYGAYSVDFSSKLPRTPLLGTSVNKG